MLRIAITDDHALFRKSLKLLINSFRGMKVCLEAGEGNELIAKLESTDIDILLLDLEMPGMDGFETAGRIKEYYPTIKILVLTHLNESGIIKKVVETGVHGFFTKNTAPKELEDAIYKLDIDGFYFERNLSKVILEILNNRQETLDADIRFTHRELEIITLTAKGLKAKEVADVLFISTKTVNAHKQNIQNKYKFESMMNAILYCIKTELIDLKTFNIKNR